MGKKKECEGGSPYQKFGWIPLLLRGVHFVPFQNTEYGGRKGRAGKMECWILYLYYSGLIL